MSDKPPKLELAKGYDFWKQQLNSWELTTDYAKEKRAHLVILHSLDRNLQEEMYAKVTAANLVTPECLKHLTDALDNKYKVKDSLKQYLYFDELVDFRREEDVTIAEFTEEFERKIGKLPAAQCVLPDPVIAHTYVKNAGLSDTAKATLKASVSDMTFDNLKEAMLRIYTNNFGSNSDSREIKQECMYTERGYRGGYRSNRGRFRGQNKRYNDNRDQDNRDRRDNKDSMKKNPIDPATGKPFRCFNCDSEKHMARECPQNHTHRRSRHRRRPSTYPTYYSEDNRDPQDENEAHLNISLLSLDEES